MARRRTSGGRERGGLSREDWWHLGRVAVALTAVGGTLLLGAVLQDESVPTGESGPWPLDPIAVQAPPRDGVGVDDAVRTDIARREPVPAPTEQAAPRPQPPGASPGSLAERIADDRRRLAAEDDAWTLQLMAACDPANVERTVSSVGSDRRLHVLPARIDGRACYRLCWGPYATRAAAEADRDRLPSPVRSLPGTPQPRPVAELL